ncbi:chemokine (C-X-C motif) ligand 18b [Mugil cephalus]|uniref:chemokine (C-X-C motif) ligand 18b n=1 Tax=Mugil cephalus TaxID=48193 RepID=UPI001FB822D0|nr:chemokine (C-X-C motif) ligand 18b [Mugil cephalus]
MALSQRNCAFLLVFVAAVWMECSQAQHFFGRCSCPNTVKFVKGNISDFEVLERRPGCDLTEVILTQSNANNSTERICMNTEGKMAKAFLRCWERINKDESRKMECIERKKRAEDKASKD